MSLDILKQYYQEQPFEVSLEIFSICNARCTFCPYTEIERKGHKMPDELIDRVIEEMAAFRVPFYFSPFKVSDPLLDKRLYSILKKVNKKAPLARIRIFTNGSALTYAQAEQLNDIDNLELWISLNEHRADKYKELMGIDYDRVIKNIDMLHDTDFRHPTTVLRVGVEPEFRVFCEARWPDYKVAMLKKDGWLGFTDPDSEEVPKHQCGRWYELSIMSTGIVAMCCMDAVGKYAIGDINKQTLLEVYNSPTWKRYRESERRDLMPCKECSY